MINRRAFLKSIGGVVSGMAGLCLLPKKKRVKCKICRDRGRVWSQDIKEDIDMATTPQLVLSVRSCDCPAGIAREKRLDPMKAEIVNKDFQHVLSLNEDKPENGAFCGVNLIGPHRKPIADETIEINGKQFYVAVSEPKTISNNKFTRD